MSRIARPTIAIVAAVALGVAACLIGLHFSQPAKSPATITAPILAPSVGSANSAVSGYETVATPGTKGVDPGTQKTIDALNKTDGLSDVAAARTVGDSTPTPQAGADDPCATGASGDCPTGLQGSIAFDTFSTPANLDLFPSTQEHAGSLYNCPAVTTGQGIDIITTAPADVTLHYWPQDDPTAVQTLVVHSQPGDADAWAAANAARGGYTHDLETFQHCATLTGLRSIGYTVQALAIDVLLRISATKTLQFDPRGNPVEPQMLVLPIGVNKLYVSVPSGPSPLPDVRAWVVPTGTAPDCSTYTNSRKLLSVEPEQVLTVSAADLARAHLDPEYTKRVVDVFSAPEGSTIVVCARWFDHAGPTWNVDTPLKQRAVVAQSPDALTPIVFFDSYNLSSGVPANSFNIFASTVDGTHCGDTGLFPVTDNQTGNRSGLGRQLCIEGGELDYGIAGDITITVAYHHVATNLTTTSVLPISRLECLGTCALPLESHFQVPVSTDAGVIGSVHLTVRWQQGHQNGRSRWSVGGVDITSPTAAVPDNPQFDSSVVVTSAVAADGWTANAGATIRSDRHTTFRATIAGDCSNPGAVTEVTGETVGSGLVYSAPIAFTGLCMNTYYVVTVVLTDDSGHQTTADAFQHGVGTYWGGGIVVTATDHIRIVASIAAVQGTSSGVRAWKFRSLQQSLAGYGPDTLGITGGCQPRSTLRIPVDSTVVVPKVRSVQVGYSATVAEEGLYFGVNHDSDCSWPGPTVSTATIDRPIAYGDLLRGVDITVPFVYTFDSGTTTNTGFSLTVHLVGTLQH